MKRATICSLLLASLLLFAGSCSPLYVMQAGWEEAGILWRRRDISEIIQSKDVDQSTEKKLALVLEARDYAERIGLKPKGSFTQYSTVDREVLVWVLSGAEKTSLTPVTWWFPIVGSVPYKGFFDKEDADAAAKELTADGYDVYLRPSSAFSTLGWFDDPLLSTAMGYSDVTIVNTVIHEILHNTIWINGDVDFNETFANFVGSIGAEKFFETKDGVGSARSREAADLWHDEVIFARFLAELSDKLSALYGRKAELGDDSILKQRKVIYDQAIAEWNASKAQLKTSQFAVLGAGINNASILAHQTYLRKPWLFETLFEQSGRNLPEFVKRVESVVKKGKEVGDAPFVALAKAAEQGSNFAP